MPLQNFVDGEEPTVDADWLNDVDVLLVTVFANATTAALARTALGATSVGSSVFTAVDAAAARTAIGINRVVVIADATSITPNADTTDVGTQVNTQALGTLTMNAPTGTPTNGQKLIIRIVSTNVQTFSWNGSYRSGLDTILPSATTGGGKYDYMGFIYNSTSLKWDIIGKSFGY